ncbi:small, acid-soluble spore protein [Geomicrobium sp. JCM 19037]|uniref:small acid-soluble spore protein SspI n=1 Tax=unclassified Geomicrobium TaxID=2628951 RepID=UPI00045F358B|nr:MULTISPECIES: small acid-soluble spore protein SspI [unclassified Geomicrobium]GAK02968.1 small, acid-soluble spore protein [Geomicrobium sp. JCM 19037]GAK12508.1 small, acid-soluble spore protein [Geomicrobium sp. JCM 19039]
MGLNLRHAILDNVSGSDASQIEATITDAISSGEEKMLPGLGVLFEVYWNEADETQKQQVIDQISSGVK